MAQDIEFKINPKEIIRILLENRNFVWLMCKYKYKPNDFKVSFDKVLKSENVGKLLLELDSLLAHFGITMEPKI